MSDRDRIRAAKRSRGMIRHGEYDEPDSYRELSPVPGGPHAPMKKESQLLRRLMAETGLTEEELREHKKYRVQLSEAQKEKGTKTAEDRFCIRLVKRITRELKLPKEHPTCYSCRQSEA